jgi:hypothetical protein
MRVTQKIMPLEVYANLGMISGVSIFAEVRNAFIYLTICCVPTTG